MNADPTVIYAVDTMDLREKSLAQWTKFVFWTTVDKSLGRVKVTDDLTSLQTYTNPGLPDAPIATPTLASIEAALDPDKADYLFFYACPGTNTHTFAKTAAQHSRNITQCKPVQTVMDHGSAVAAPHGRRPGTLACRGRRRSTRPPGTIADAPRR